MDDNTDKKIAVKRLQRISWQLCGWREYLSVAPYYFRPSLLPSDLHWEEDA